MVSEVLLPRAVVRAALLLRGSKRVLRSPQRSHKSRSASALRPARYGPPARMESRAEISAQASPSGWTVYTVQSSTRAAAPVDVIYLHGGAYTQEMTTTHWKFIEQLAARTGARVVVPIYPLAPTATASLTVPHMVELVSRIGEANAARGLVIMGDSAGGGMALALTQQLRDLGQRLPDQLILISPWLDITVADPRARLIEARDPMLAIAGLQGAGLAYAGDLELTDPLVSPLFGNLTGLPPMLCFTGDADVLNPDSLTLADKLTPTDRERFVLERASSEFHVYPLLPTRAGAEARTRVVRSVATVGASYTQAM